MCVIYILSVNLITFFYRIEDLNELLNVCFERLNSWKESYWIIYQLSCREECSLQNKNVIKRLFHCISTDEEFLDIKCIVPALRTFGNIIAIDSSDYSTNELIIGLKKDGIIIKNILIKNRQVNLNNECAWLLGNVLNVLKITEFKKDTCLVSKEDLNEIFNYLII